MTRCGCITIFANSRIRSHSSRYPVPATVPDGSPSGSDPQPGLDNNPGIDAKLFADSHPYIANAYPGAQEAVRKAVKETDRVIKEFEQYDTKKWEHSYISNNKDGYVVTEIQRIKEAKMSKNEEDKYKKEFRMCCVAADNGHKVEYLHGLNRPQGETYDITFDGTPTDLKSTGSIGNIVKYVKKAYKQQGAEAILIEFEINKPEVYDKLNESKRKYNIRIYFYFKEERKIREYR